MIGNTLGSYRVVEQIGMGGMATVYKAYDPDTDRYVAIKVLSHHYSQEPTFLERFRREARAIASLEHMNILPVFGYGEQDGIAYLVMRYMDSGTLTDVLARGPLSLDESSRLLGQIAAALDYAHRKGVIHRDVKPANVLVDGEGNAYLTDFGIAKIMAATLELTASGGIVGTPQYMSPEQCRGEKELTAATDIYSLGIVLYQMVTGQVPFQAETPMAVIQQHLNAPLPPPRSVRPDIPDAVEGVVLKAMAKEPRQRFPAAAAMGEALAQAVRSSAAQADTEPAQPPPAQPGEDLSSATLPMPPERRRRRVWPWLVAGGIIAAAAMLGGALLLGGVLGGLAAPGEEAETPAGEKVPAGGEDSSEDESPVVEETPAPDAPVRRIAFTSDRDGDMDIYVMDVDGSNVAQLTDSAAFEFSPVWSPDGSRIAFYSDRDGDNDIYVIDADGSNVVQLTDDPAAEISPAWSPDGSHIAFILIRNRNSDIFVMDADGSNVTQLTDDPAFERDPAWSPDGSRIAFSSSSNDSVSINVIDANGSNAVQLTSGLDDSMPAWSPDGSRIAFYSPRDGDFDIYVMDADGSNVVQLTSNPDYDGFPAWSPDGSRIAFHSDRDGDNDIYVMDADGSNVVQLTDDPASDGDPDWSPTHSTAGGGCGNLSRYVRDVTIPDGTKMEPRESFTKTWRLLNSGTCDWDEYQLVFVADEQMGGPDTVAVPFTSAGEEVDVSVRLTAPSETGTYYSRWRMTNAEGIQFGDTYFANIVVVGDSAPSAASGRIVFQSYRDGDWDIYVMDADGSNVVQLTDDPARDTAPAWSPDGSRIAFASDRDGDDSDIYVMDADGSNVVQLTDNLGDVTGLSWSPNGSLLVLSLDGNDMSSIAIVDADSSDVAYPKLDIGFAIRPVWSPDGSRIAFEAFLSGNSDIYVMDANGSNVVQLTDDPAYDWGAAWSPDGSHIAFASNRDGNFDIYMMDADGSNVIQLADDPADDEVPSWSPDGSHIAFQSDRDGDFEIYMMDADGSDVVQLTDNRVADMGPAWHP